MRKSLPHFIGSDQSDSAILFIHGLGGSYLTWKDFSNHLKNTWKEKDSFNLEYDEYYSKSNIYFVRRFINIWKIIKGSDINLLSEHLKTVIDETCHEYENIIIIAHSMGGLVARQYIINQIKKDKQVGKLKALITYSTPHHGSIIANYFQFVVNNPLPAILNPLSIFKSKQVFQLAKSSEFLENLNSDWSKLRIDDKIDFKRVVGFDDSIVDIDSSKYIENSNEVRGVANKNHFSIIKPNSLKDPAFMVSYNYLKEFKGRLEKKKEFEEDYEEFREDYEDGE